MLLMAIALRAIGVDRFGHVHENSSKESIFGLIKLAKEGFKNAFFGLRAAGKAGKTGKVKE